MLCDSPEESCGERWGDLYSSVYDNVFVIKDSNQFNVFGLAVQMYSVSVGPFYSLKTKKHLGIWHPSIYNTIWLAIANL